MPAALRASAGRPVALAGDPARRRRRAAVPVARAPQPVARHLRDRALRALFATPFAIHARLGGMLEADARWERALLWWGAVARAARRRPAVGLPSGFDSDSLAGSLGLVTVVEAALVLATLVVWLISG